MSTRTRPSSKYRVLVPVCMVVVSVLAAACGHSSPPKATSLPASTSTTAAPTPTVSTPIIVRKPTTEPGTTTTTSSVPGTTVVAASDTCGSALSGSLVGSEGAAGTHEATFAFKNGGSTSCQVSGYPSISMESTGTALTTTVETGGSLSFEAIPVTVVTLPAGESAFVNVGYSDIPAGSGSCPTSSDVVFGFGSSSKPSISIPAVLNVCNNGALTPSPIFGSTSSYTYTTAPTNP